MSRKEENKRWTRGRKLDVVLRALKGESADDLSREYGIESYLVEEWKEAALAGAEEALRSRAAGAERQELEAAKKQIGQLSMENELLRERCRKQEGFRKGRSKN